MSRWPSSTPRRWQRKRADSHAFRKADVTLRHGGAGDPGCDPTSVDRAAVERPAVGGAERLVGPLQRELVELGGGVAGAAARRLDARERLLRLDPAVGAHRPGPRSRPRRGAIVRVERPVPLPRLGDQSRDPRPHRRVVGDDRLLAHRLLDRQPLVRPRRQRREGALGHAAGEQCAGECGEEGGALAHRSSLCARPRARNTGLRRCRQRRAPRSGGCAPLPFPLCRTLPRARSSAG